MDDIRSIGVRELSALGPEGLNDLTRKIDEAHRLLGGAATNAAIAPEVIPAKPQESLDTLASPGILNLETITPLHTFMSAHIARAIADHNLSPEYELPAVDTFAEQVTQLASTYETFESNHWDPAVVFVPRGLAPSDLTELFTGFNLDTDGLRVSERATIADGIDDPRKVTFLNDRDDRKYTTHGPYWELAVASCGDSVLFPKLTAKGEGKNADAIVEALQKLGLRSNGSSESLIESASPTALMYIGLQWQRLLCGKAPLGSARNDTFAGVILKEKIKDTRRVTADGNQEMTLSGEWMNNSTELRIATVGTNYSEYMLWGVNPMIRARDLDLK